MVIGAGLLLSGVVQAQFKFITNNGSIKITSYIVGGPTTVIIPSTTNGLPINAIASKAFEAGYFVSVSIPQSVTNIEYGAFTPYNSSGLTNIDVDSNNQYYTSVGGVLYDKSLSTLLQFPPARNGSFTVPDGVTSINGKAFYNASPLRSVVLPNSVTNIGEWAFSSCLSMTNIVIGTNIANVGASAFNYCLSLPSIVLGNKVTSIGDSNFYNCTALTNVIVGNNVTNIGGSAFYLCSSLANLSIGGSYINIGDNAFYNCSKLTNFTIPDSVTNIGSFAFKNCSGLASVSIGTNVNSIGREAFESCSKLTSLTNPASLTGIGNYAFWACSSLTNVFFLGNAPTNNGVSIFQNANAGLHVYYLPGTTGWDVSFFGRATVLWKPLVLTKDGSFGVQTNQFGFNINWASGQQVVVEGSTDLTNWVPLQTNVLTTGTSYFSDTQWTNNPQRYYRIRSP